MSPAQTETGDQSAQRIVLRNAGFLVAAQALGMPLSLAITVFAARYLGANMYGQLYLATTFVSLAFVFVEWGQGLALTGAIARQRDRAGELLASGLAIRLLLAPIALAVMAMASLAFGYDAAFRMLLVLVTLAALATSISNALQDSFRAHERNDLSVRAMVGIQALSAGVVLPVLFSGAGLQAFVLAQACCTLAGCVLLWVVLRKLGVGALRVRLDSMRSLAVMGAPFLVFGLVLVLQTSVDAFFLSRLAPADVVGWNAVARKLLGVLVYPASALVGALYPTLCRLQAHDPQRFGATASGALRLALLIGTAAGLGCIFYPELGVAAFGATDYARSCENLRVLGVFIVLVYISMPISSALMALGRQRIWSLVQFVCVILSAVLDPLLIPWFQTHFGNGGLGVCVAGVLSELLMVAAGFALLPGGVLGADLLRTVLAVAAAGLCLAAVAEASAGWNAWLAAPCAMLAYATVLLLSGEIHKTQIFMRNRNG